MVEKIIRRIEENEIPQDSRKDSVTNSAHLNPKLVKAVLVIAIASIIISIGSLVFVLTLTSKHDKVVPHDETVKSDVKIVTRNEWLAQPPKEKLDLLQLPVGKVIILHTATEECTYQSACTYRVRFIQDHHISVMNYDDIGYNFLIGGDGNVYEGRGWLKVGEFLKGQNAKSIGIAFIGDYRHSIPSKAQMETLNHLLANGTRGGFLKSDFKLFGACQLQATDSPGRLLYEELKKHPHWSDEYD